MSRADRHDVVEQAAGWLVRLEQDGSAGTRQAWQLWHDADPANAEVWQRFAALQRAVPGRDSAGASALGTVDFRRRRGLKLMACAAAAGLGGAGLYGHAQRAGWLADYRTAAGEQRSLALRDDVLLVLNTGTSVDVTQHERQLDILVHSGEVMLDIRRANALVRILTCGGVIEPDDAHLVVRAQGADTRVALLEGQATINTRNHLNGSLQAGQLRRFTADHIHEEAGWAGREFAWVQGMLIADDMRLEDFLAELARYRPGLVQCAPEVASLRVNGSFRLKNTDQILEALAATLGLRLVYRTRYWVHVGSA